MAAGVVEVTLWPESLWQSNSLDSYLLPLVTLKVFFNPLEDFFSKSSKLSKIGPFFSKFERKKITLCSTKEAKKLAKVSLAKVTLAKLSLQPKRHLAKM